MKRITLALAVCVALLAGVLSASTASADAIPGLSISRVGYNAAGADVWTNRNQEYVDVTNRSGAPIDVKGLVVEDAWAKANGDDNPRRCNTFTVTSLPGITIPADGENAGKLLLPAWHTIRVYTGSGRPAVFGAGDRIHAVYMNSRCGYHGHYLGNTADTVWIVLGDAAESLSWDFSNGYYVR